MTHRTGETALQQSEKCAIARQTSLTRLLELTHDDLASNTLDVGNHLDLRPRRTGPRQFIGMTTPDIADQRRTKTGKIGPAFMPHARINHAERTFFKQLRREML